VANLPVVFAIPFFPVIGILAGGAKSFLRAKEGFEDSAEMGKRSLEEHHPSSKDLVFLISASGSARFNLGAAESGVSHGCGVYYVYNSPQVRGSELEKLFSGGKVKSVLVDIGPQTITGSTRLQAASFGLVCFGLILTRVMELRRKSPFKSDSSEQQETSEDGFVGPQQLLLNLRAGFDCLFVEFVVFLIHSLYYFSKLFVILLQASNV